MSDVLDVLFEDNHCLAVVKPPRMLTADDRTGDRSLLALVREYVRRKYRKPGKVYLGLVHRLDRPVSGVVLLARTSKAAGRLCDQFRAGAIRKIYHALVEGAVEPSTGEFCDYLLKDRARNVVETVTPDTAGARLSRLSYRRLRSGHAVSLLEIEPQTGRSHQIRVQLAVRGLPICGDRKYGSTRPLHGAIALHAVSLSFEHPVRHTPITLTAPYPSFWNQLLPGPA
jgi:23S rRNA pseudouridine1911/1915/1917 synthase